MAVVTLTELNQHPSRVARMAETEPVHIRRYGRDYLVLRREDDPLAAMRAAGLIRSPKTTGTPLGPLPHLDVTAEEGEAIYEEFIESRGDQ